MVDTLQKVVYNSVLKGESIKWGILCLSKSNESPEAWGVSTTKFVFFKYIKKYKIILQNYNTHTYVCIYATNKYKKLIKLRKLQKYYCLLTSKLQLTSTHILAI